MVVPISHGGGLLVNWKTELQVSCPDSDQKLEMTCKVCGHVHYLTPEMMMCSPELEFLYLDEIETEAVCKSRGGRGRVRMAIVRNGRNVPPSRSRLRGRGMLAKPQAALRG